MQSAFGVEHGSAVSKGWGNFMRGAKKVASATEAAPTKLATEGNVYTLQRDQARMYGQSASRKMASDPAAAGVHRRMGADAKRRSRLTLQTSNAYRAENTPRRLP